MIVVFNKGLSSEQSYQIHSCSEKLNNNLNDNSKSQTIHLMYQTEITNMLTGQQYFYNILQPNYSIESISIEHEEQVLLTVTGYNNIIECSTTYNYINDSLIMKFISIIINKEDNK